MAEATQGFLLGATGATTETITPSRPSYPSQLASLLGLYYRIRQQVMIAMALACYPKPVISDEPMEDVILKPIHPYTKALITNVPIPDPTVKGKRILVWEETPTPLDLPEGCRFCPRCTEPTALCKRDEPELRKVGADRWVACHNA